MLVFDNIGLRSTTCRKVPIIVHTGDITSLNRNWPRPQAVHACDTGINREGVFCKHRSDLEFLIQKLLLELLKSLLLLYALIHFCMPSVGKRVTHFIWVKMLQMITSPYVSPG